MPFWSFLGDADSADLLVPLLSLVQVKIWYISSGNFRIPPSKKKTETPKTSANHEVVIEVSGVLSWKQRLSRLVSSIIEKSTPQKFNIAPKNDGFQ